MILGGAERQLRHAGSHAGGLAPPDQLEPPQEQARMNLRPTDRHENHGDFPWSR